MTKPKPAWAAERVRPPVAHKWHAIALAENAILRGALIEIKNARSELSGRALDLEAARELARITLEKVRLSP